MFEPTGMGASMFRALFLLMSLGSCLCHLSLASEFFAAEIQASNKEQRTKITTLGVAIDRVSPDSVHAVITHHEKRILERQKVKFKAYAIAESRLHEQAFFGPPTGFRDYDQSHAALESVAAKYPKIAKVLSLGKSLEGRDIWAIRLSSNPIDDSLPTAVFLGCHHAREYLSAEVPLRLAEHLADHYGTDPIIQNLLDHREVWIAPVINPDGLQYDLTKPGTLYWRKNRRFLGKYFGSDVFGVDLNRNYDAGWSLPGASADPLSPVYHGPNPFSEPETKAIRDFIEKRKRATVLLTYHSFSELVLWPYGYTYDQVQNSADRLVFEWMGKKMAADLKYKPMKISELYLASGETTDWAYDKHRIFGFTFELSPRSFSEGGFYPNTSLIDQVFKDNIKPALFLVDKAENPYSILK